VTGCFEAVRVSSCLLNVFHVVLYLDAELNSWLKKLDLTTVTIIYRNKPQVVSKVTLLDMILSQTLK